MSHNVTTETKQKTCYFEGNFCIETYNQLEIVFMNQYATNH